MKMHQKNSVFNVLEEFFVFKTWTEVKIIMMSTNDHTMAGAVPRAEEHNGTEI